MSSGHRNAAPRNNVPLRSGNGAAARRSRAAARTSSIHDAATSGGGGGASGVGRCAASFESAPLGCDSCASPASPVALGGAPPDMARAERDAEERSAAGREAPASRRRRVASGRARSSNGRSAVCIRRFARARGAGTHAAQEARRGGAPQRGRGRRLGQASEEASTLRQPARRAHSPHPGAAARTQAQHWDGRASEVAALTRHRTARGRPNRPKSGAKQLNRSRSARRARWRPRGAPRGARHRRLRAPPARRGCGLCVTVGAPRSATCAAQRAAARLLAMPRVMPATAMPPSWTCRAMTRPSRGARRLALQPRKGLAPAALHRARCRAALSAARCRTRRCGGARGYRLRPQALRCSSGG